MMNCYCADCESFREKAKQDALAAKPVPVRSVRREGVSMKDDPRAVIAKAIQGYHDDVCFDYECKCHVRDWNEDLQVFISETAIEKADELIAEIEDAAVRRYNAAMRRYRGLE